MEGYTGNLTTTDPCTGFCKAKSTFYSKRKPIPLPANQSLEVTTFISSRAHSGRFAFIEAATGRQLTFSDVWREVYAVATSLSEDYGIRKGHVVLLLTPNCIYFPIVCLAVMSLGAVITTTNPLNTSREIAKQRSPIRSPYSLSPFHSSSLKSVVQISPWYSLCIFECQSHLIPDYCSCTRSD